MTRHGSCDTMCVMAMRRSAVPLTAVEREAVDRARRSPLLVEMLGQDPELALPSEASALHALVVLGLRAVQDAELERGYAQLAVSRDAEDEAYERAVRSDPRRRRSAFADEAEGAA